jgi:hypothetical protein
MISSASSPQGLRDYAKIELCSILNTGALRMENLIAVKVERVGDERVITGYVRRGGRRQVAWQFARPMNEKHLIPSVAEEVERARKEGKPHKALLFKNSGDTPKVGE